MKTFKFLLCLLLVLPFGLQANEFEGTGAGASVTTGYYNAALGQFALNKLTTGYRNAVLGERAGFSLTTGYGNVLIGAFAGYALTTSTNKLYITNMPSAASGIFGDFSTGYFGINTTTPTVAWDIVGDLNVSGAITGAILGNQFSYQIASAVFDVDQSITAIYTWLTPTDAGTEQDLSPHNLDATYVDASDFSSADKIAKGLVWALDFDGANDYLTVADASAWSFDGSSDAAFSIGFWFQVVAGADSQGVIAKWDASGTPDREWAIFLDSDEKLTFAVADEADDKYATNKIDTALSDDTWYFIVHTYDGTAGSAAMSDANTIWYVDCVAVAESQTNDGNYTNMVAGSTAINIGALDYGVLGNYFLGDLGMLFVANTELSADNIWQIYLATRGYYNE